MKPRRSSFAWSLLLSAAVVASLLVTPAAAKKRPKPPPPPPPPTSSTSSTYVNHYANVVDGVKCNLTPAAVAATSDGGSAMLALSSGSSSLSSASCAGVNWIAKVDPSGNPQWQKLVGCFNLAPGYYSLGVSMRQTADGGYVIGGGTLGCGPSTICPEQCGLVERLDASGNVVWSRVYSSGAGDRESVLYSIRQTSDGGFVGAGTFRNADSNLGGWIIKLDSAGTVQWQRKLGPGGPSGPTVRHALFEAVTPTADGGYIAAGEIMNYERNSFGDYGVLVVKLDANGNVRWQREFGTFDGNGVPTSSNRAFAIVQTPDGGSLVGGKWVTATLDGTCCSGALLMKLDASGAVQWQKAYHGGVQCSTGGGGKTRCSAVGPIVRSLHATPDGGYVLAGDTQLAGGLGVPLVPWLAKVDGSGTLLWQHTYFGDSHSAQYFASADLASNGGHVAVGFASNNTDFTGELLAVKTDSEGRVGGCTQIHPAPSVETVDSGLATFLPGLPVQATNAAQAGVPSTTQATSTSITGSPC
jgi:hypothetical protein